MLADASLRAQRHKSSKSLFGLGLRRHMIGGLLRVGLCRIDGLALLAVLPSDDAAPQVDELRTKDACILGNVFEGYNISLMF